MSQMKPVRRPLRRLELHFEPVDPNTPPGVSGPLEVVHRPLRRVALQPLQKYDLIVKVVDGTDAKELFQRVLAYLNSLNDFMITATGSPIEVDLPASQAQPGELRIRLFLSAGEEPATVLNGKLQESPYGRDSTLVLAA
jgi:hypothetical protein